MGTNFGVWAWGTVTAAMGTWLIVVVLIGKPQSLYERVKDSATVLGAVVAASALAWSLFYQEGNARQRQLEQDIRTMADDLSTIKDDLAILKQHHSN